MGLFSTRKKSKYGKDSSTPNAVRPRAGAGKKEVSAFASALTAKPNPGSKRGVLSIEDRTDLKTAGIKNPFAIKRNLASAKTTDQEKMWGGSLYGYDFNDFDLSGFDEYYKRSNPTHTVHDYVRQQARNRKYKEDPAFREYVKKYEKRSFSDQVKDIGKGIGRVAGAAAPFLGAAALGSHFGWGTAGSAAGGGATAGGIGTIADVAGPDPFSIGGMGGGTAGVVGGGIAGAPGAGAALGSGYAGAGGLSLAGPAVAGAIPAGTGGIKTPAGAGAAGGTVGNTATAAGTTAGLSNLFSGTGAIQSLLDLYGWDQSQNALEDSMGFQEDMFAAQNPWSEHQQEMGDKLLGLIRDPSAIEDTPGYKFAFDQGLKGLMAKQAQTGNRFSGRALTEATQFGEGLASQMYNSEMDRFAKLAGAYQPTSGGIETGMNMSANTQQQALNTPYFLQTLFERYKGKPPPSTTDQNTTPRQGEWK